MNQEVILYFVSKFADECHGKQLRKYSFDPYIVHPIRVMNTCKKVTDKIYILVAALLHDVLEDTKVSKKQVRDFLMTLLSEEDTDKAMVIILDLTDEYTKEKYPQYNRRKRKALEANRLGECQEDTQTVKYADLIDNTEDIMSNDLDFAKIYVPECWELLDHMKIGEKTLRSLAVDGLLNSKRILEGIKQS